MFVTHCVQNSAIFWDHLLLSATAFTVDLCFFWFASKSQSSVAGISSLSELHSEVENQKLSICYVQNPFSSLTDLYRKHFISADWF